MIYPTLTCKIMIRTMLLFFTISVLFFSCGKDGKNNFTSISKEDLPMSKGKGGRIIIVIDSTTADGPIGQELEALLTANTPGLPRPEPMFNINFVQPSKMNNSLRMYKNIMYVTILNSDTRGNRWLQKNFDAASVERVKEDPGLFMYPKENEFAKDQAVLHIFGLTEDQLYQNLLENGEAVVNYFDKKENSRTYHALYNAPPQKGIANLMWDKYDCSLDIPQAWDIAMQKDDFIWLRLLDSKIDKSIFVTFRPYTSEDIFSKENLIEWREETGEKYIYGNPERPETYIVTETEHFPVKTNEINFKGKFAVKMWGLWRTNNKTMGGPFLSYTMVDESSERIYYIEGFVYSPGEDQRETMRELEMILSTFETEKENQPS